MLFSFESFDIIHSNAFLMHELSNFYIIFTNFDIILGIVLICLCLGNYGANYVLILSNEFISVLIMS